MNPYNLSELQPNSDWATLPLFDRKNWTRVRFGDVVQNVVASQSEPAAKGIERFIGLEHLEPGSLWVRAWGDVADGTTFTRLCAPGQVLFGKRRAYQRKVAVADFDAVVSGDIYVFAPKNERLLPDLLPFLCLSERFFEHAVGTSAGSLSPRTNWSSLAAFEFDLPPLDQQRRIADVLWAMNGSAVIWEAAQTETDNYRKRLIDDLVLRGTGGAPLVETSIGEIPESWKTAHLADVCERVSVGIASAATHAYKKKGIPLIRNQNIKEGYLDCADLLFVTPEFDQQYAGKRLLAGDVLTVRTGYPGVSAVVPKELEHCQSFTTLVSRPIKSILQPEFLCYWINSAHGKKFVNVGKGGAAQQNLNAGMLGKMRLPIPPLSEQQHICKIIHQAIEAQRYAELHTQQLVKLQIHLREIFIVK